MIVACRRLKNCLVMKYGKLGKQKPFPDPVTTFFFSLLKERLHRCQDIAMLAMFNSKERSEAEWRDLVASADSRFRFESIVRLMPSPLAVMEIIWDSQ